MATASSTQTEHATFPNHGSHPAHQSPPRSLPVQQQLLLLQRQHSQQSQAIEAAKDIVFGSIAGVVGKLVEYPFDTIKVRLQSQSTHPLASSKLDGPLDAFAAAWRSSEGPFKSLYRGISAPLFGAAVETSSLFFSYRMAQDILVANIPSLHSHDTKARHEGDVKANLPFSALLLAGAASGAFTSLLLTPIELIKCKMQVPFPPPTPFHIAPELGYTTTIKAPGPYQLIKQVFQSQGLLGFWHGQLGTLIRETGGSASWFGSYEGVKILFEHYNNNNNNNNNNKNNNNNTNPSPITFPQQLLAGATAGISYNFFFYPADTIKSRMQTEISATATTATLTPGSRPQQQQQHRMTSFWHTATELWRNQGLKGFYRGCGITVLRAAPSSAIIFSIYEELKRGFG